METDTQPDIEVDSATQAMQEAGVATEIGVYDDYFGFSTSRNVVLPDGKSFVTIKQLNEGDRKVYLNAVNKDITIQRSTGDAKMKVASGDDRHALLKAAIIGWNLHRRNERTGDLEPVPFRDNEVTKFLNAANPKVIDLIEKEIRKDNDWIVGEVTVEDIDKQIEELQELRTKKVAESEGKGS